MSKSRRHAIIRYLSSVRVGIILLALILVYASVGSALPQIRGAVELSEMDVFRHWLFSGLMIAFSVVLIVATLVRIPFKIVNAGVLTVHLGLLMLVGGSIYYFGTKVEGDVKLESPRIRLSSLSGMNERTIAEFLAEEGSAWSTFMPAFGGEVRAEVQNVERNALGEITSAGVRYQVGATSEPQVAQLIANQSAEMIGDGRLVLRLTVSGPADRFYDDEVPALYLSRAEGGDRAVEAIHGLPLYSARYLDEGDTLVDTDSRPVPSRRSTPHMEIAGLSIPTTIFESWRLPIRISPKDAPFDIEITGFVPYVGRLDADVGEGSGPLNPAIKVRFALGSESRAVSLFAMNPAQSVAFLGVPVEFKWVENADQFAPMAEDRAGPHELEIEVKDPPAKMRLAVSLGQTIAVEGTPYELKISELRPDWPMMTPGYEGASSPMASVDVTNGEKKYNRTVIQRFPELSQDIDEQGVRHRDAPYDPNLVLRYRACGDGWVTIAAGPSVSPKAFVADFNGQIREYDLTVGEPSSLNVLGVELATTIEGLYQSGQTLLKPVLVPPESRRPNLAARSVSAIRIKFVGRGAASGWSESRWSLFSMYPDDPTARPVEVAPPTGGKWRVLYSRLERPLNARLVPGKLSVKHFPGRENVESWRSDFKVVRAGQPVESGEVLTNQTMSTGEWTLYQSGASQDGWGYTILGVGNRNGIIPMVLGCVMITFGCLFAFYVKPVLLKRAAASGRRAAAARRASALVASEVTEDAELETMSV
ncbi:MAG: hypothetical protein KF841_06945 [Phycisphaerae bacterium]|nr:hypothetical protein [Phycisphaerae bacterium]